MKKTILMLAFLAIFGYAEAGNGEPKEADKMETIKLKAPDLKRGKPVMQAFADRKSTREFSPQKLSLQDLSEVLWAANGINRPETGGRTAPSAMNRQDVTVYACMPEGTYRYDPKAGVLEPVSPGDARCAEAPVCLVLVTETAEPWAAMDAAIVSQNISIACAGLGLATYPRATMDKETLKKALKLTGTQTLTLCNPVGYFTKTK